MGRDETMNDHELHNIFAGEMSKYEDGYKTGHFFNLFNENAKNRAIENKCDCLGAGMIHVDWYCMRKADRTPVIRVKWMFPKRATRKVALCGGFTYRKTWACTHDEAKFEFSIEGFKAAAEFANTLTI